MENLFNPTLIYRGLRVDEVEGICTQQNISSDELSTGLEVLISVHRDYGFAGERNTSMALMFGKRSGWVFRTKYCENRLFPSRQDKPLLESYSKKDCRFRGILISFKDLENAFNQHYHP